jgi:glycerate-2-kinase
MVGTGRTNGVEGAIDISALSSIERNTLIRVRVAEAMRGSDLSAVFDLDGVDGNAEHAGAALKAVLAQKMTEYAIKAIEEARKRNMQLGAAAVIIAAKEG